MIKGTAYYEILKYGYGNYFFVKYGVCVGYNGDKEYDYFILGFI